MDGLDHKLSSVKKEKVYRLEILWYNNIDTFEMAETDLPDEIGFIRGAAGLEREVRPARV